MAIITGTSNSDILTGTSVADQISGLDGNDTLAGGAGADALDGGNGTDTASYLGSASGLVIDLYDGSTSTGDAAGDTFVSIEKFLGTAYADTFVAGNGTESFYGNSGNFFDTVDYSHSTAGVTLTFNVPNAGVVTGTGSGGLAVGDSYSDVDKIIGTSYDDVYIVGGTSPTNSVGFVETVNGGIDEVQTTLPALGLAANIEKLTYTGTSSFTGTGNSGNNTITGGTGNDTLTGGSGADVLDGGNGTDTANYATSTIGLVIDLYDGSTSTGDAVGDTYISVEGYKGSTYADTFIAGSAAEYLYGNSSNYIDTADYSHSASGVTLTFNIPNSGAIIGTGNGGLAQGDSFNDIDKIIGSNYDDVYIVGGTSPVSTILFVESANGGTDEVRSGFSSYGLAANIEKLTYTGTSNFTGIGNSLNNIITGGTGNDTLTGNDGDDVLMGGTGSDVLSGGNGIDAISYSSSSAGITINLTAGTANGGDAQGDTFTFIEKVIGSAYADTLSSSTNGHILQGGAGNDIYVIGNGGVIVEAAGEGTDEVQTAQTTFSIASFTNVENLTFIGTGDFTGTGNSGDNIITGSSGNDTLVGGAGADILNGGTGTDTADYSGSSSGVTVDFTAGIGTGGDAQGDTLTSVEQVTGSLHSDTLLSSTSGHVLQGGAGNDLYVIGSSGVTVTEAAGQDTDEVQTSLNSFSLAFIANVENLTFSGSGNFTGTGNSLDNIIAGGSGNDTLDGGAGTDVMIGGIDSDTYYVDNVGDVVIENAGEGINDLVYASTSYTLATNVEKLTLTGSSAIDGTGNSLTNQLTGNNAGNILSGQGGADTLSGGAGNDTLIGGAKADTLTGGADIDTFVFDILETSANKDTITDFTHGTDIIAIDRAAFTAFAGDPAGALNSSAFVVGTASTTSSEHIIYDSSTGALYYDVDGVGGAAQVQMASMTGAPTLLVSDFILL